MPDIYTHPCTCTSLEAYCSHCIESMQYGMALAREQMWHTQGDECYNFAESFDLERAKRLQKKLKPLSCIVMRHHQVKYDDCGCVFLSTEKTFTKIKACPDGDDCIKF